MAYSTPADARPFLPSGGLPNPARMATGNATGDYVELDQHGFVAEQAVVFSADDGYSVPGGLTAGTTYYVVELSSSRFKVSAAPGGSAIDLTSAGDTFAVWSDLQWAAWIEWADRMVDSFLPSHVVPVVQVSGAYPAAVVMASAELAAAMGLSRTGGAEIDLDAKTEAISTRLTRWAKSLPIRGESRSVTSPANLAIVSSASASDGSRGWVRRCNGEEVLP